jgi:membrane protease YdiL (CAAX protease family)
MKGLLRGIGYFLLYMVFTIVIQVALSFLIIQIAAGIGITGQAEIEDFANKNILGMTIVSGILTVLFLYLIFKLPKKDIRNEWKLNSFAFRDIIKPCVLTFSLSSVFSLLTLNADIENSRLIASSAEYYSSMVPFLGTVLMILNLLVIAPFAEELALRGIVYTRIEKELKPIVAIIVSAVLFGLMHFMAGGIILVAGATIMGLAFGLLMYKYKSLQICIIAHICANLPDFIYSKERFASSDLKIGLVGVFSVVLLATLFWIFSESKLNHHSK